MKDADKRDLSNDERFLIFKKSASILKILVKSVLKRTSKS